MERQGHTEAVVDMMRLSGLAPAGVLCELTNEDGTMARMPEIQRFAVQNSLPVLSVEDIMEYRKEKTTAQ